MLGPTTTLRSTSGTRSVRLSYIFEDDGGCRKGLTVRGILPNQALIAGRWTDRYINRQNILISSGEVVGILDPEFRPDTITEEDSEHEALSSGVLTRIFTIATDIEFDNRFRDQVRNQIADLSVCAGEAMFDICGDNIGTLLHPLTHMNWCDRRVYPLLRLERTERDLAGPNDRIRNGAMLTAENGALVGVIVSISKDSQFYYIAPIQDVLEWHRLRRLPLVDDSDTANEPFPLSHRRAQRESVRTSLLNDLVGG
ncbi:hypothetical protein [Aestuariivita sp.]|jgi:hypothetical protein|uniref:hypothetical protein n=1 Tax=Aestuariivita sp. TaxID=1872407 RepID=UPI00216EA439|nr:hypothetical protein [Aestuariivita sp.]MCE8006399.1 hypothetical protein [Aestuariivita sp.]